MIRDCGKSSVKRVGEKPRGIPQSQATASPRHKDEEETDKANKRK